MILSGEEIKKRLEKDKLEKDESNFDKKLIITPILNIEDQIKDDGVSVDLRLGANFVIFNKISSTYTDYQNSDYPQRRGLEQQEVEIGEKIILHPHQFILGETLEWVKMPNDLSGLLTSKSSDAREGVQVELANLIHPRFSGTITLELKNNGELPIALYPGLPICQLVIMKLYASISKETPIAKSTFRFSLGPWVATKIKKEFEILKKIKENK